MNFRILLVLFLASLIVSQPFAAAAQTTRTASLQPQPPIPTQNRTGPETGFPLPRFVSMQATEGNARRGPSRSHRIDWVFTQQGMPLIIIAEHGHWRRVVDMEGEGGWMHYSLLSGVRTGIIEADMVQMRIRPETGSPVRAQAELGAVGRLMECQGDWCLFQAEGYRGWVPQDVVWGTEPGEVFD